MYAALIFIIIFDLNATKEMTKVMPKALLVIIMPHEIAQSTHHTLDCLVKDLPQLQPTLSTRKI